MNVDKGKCWDCPFNEYKVGRGKTGHTCMKYKDRWGRKQIQLTLSKDGKFIIPPKVCIHDPKQIA